MFLQNIGVNGILVLAIALKFCYDWRMTEQKPTVCAIVAIGPDNVIGANGKMCWYCASDFYHFRKTTTPYPCIFGRVTYENLPIKPLPGRFNLICGSSYKNEYKNGVFYANSVIDAINACGNVSRVFICGGAGIYKYVLQNDLLDIMYLTKIKSPILESQIQSNPAEYARFPINIDDFFNPKQWHTTQIIYPKNILPVDKNGTSAEFFKCVRVR